MSKLIFVVGGARSGKSSFAVSLCRGKVAFVATAEARDDEMRMRIAKHKIERPKAWKTFEAPRDLVNCIKRIPKHTDSLLVDCMTLFISNLLCDDKSEAFILRNIKEAIKTLKQRSGLSVIVSNEVGMGIVPDSELGREFRDVAGRVNQILAKSADEVYFTVSGLPWRIK